jgi:hypothetical protein
MDPKLFYFVSESDKNMRSGSRLTKFSISGPGAQQELKGQSHEKVGEIRVEGDSLGPN